MATQHEMTAVEVFASDIKHQIAAGASDLKTYIREGATHVVGQLTAEVHDVSLKLDAFKYEHDVQVDMMNTELRLLKAQLAAQTWLITKGFWLTLVMLIMIYAQSASHFQWNVDEVSFPGWRPDFVRGTPKTVWGIQEKYLGTWAVGLVNATKQTAEASKEDCNLRFVAEGLIWACDWFLVNE